MQQDDARARFERLSAQVQARWLDPAEGEFLRLGFGAASLNRILAQIGASKGQFYYYFADKSALYRAVIERALAELGAALDARLPAPGGTAAEFWCETAALFGRITQVLDENTRFAELGRGIYREAAAQAALAGPLEMLRGQVEALVTAGQLAGAVRDDLPVPLLATMAFAVARAADEWFAFHASALGPERAAELNARLTQLFIAMLAPPGRAAELAIVGDTTEGPDS